MARMARLDERMRSEMGEWGRPEWRMKRAGEMEGLLASWEML
jgi:hypothetical protein